MSDIKKNTVEISATSAEQFANAEQLLNGLSDIVRDQIKSAKFGGVGLECEFGVYKLKMRDNQISVWLPFGSRQIQNFGDYIGIYVGESNYFFTIRDEQLLKCRISYNIEEAPKKTQP